MIDLRSAMLLAVLSAFGAAAGTAQEPEAPPPAPPPVEQDADAAVERWIQDLGSDSFRTRLDAENQLRQLGAKVLPRLRRAAESAADHEVQWRARRLIRQIERGDERGLVQRSQRAPRPDDGQGLPPGERMPLHDIEGRFESLFREMEQRFGLDIPRARFFHDDFFRDLQDQLQDGRGHSQGMSLRIGPDGTVRVEVQERDADGKVENKVYEAPDMQTFEQQYPGVLQRGGLGFDWRGWPPNGSFFRAPFPLSRDRLGPFADRSLPGVPGAEAESPAEVEQLVRTGQRLGVSVRPEIPAELREHLELGDDVGLMVQSVAEGSLAAALGLRAGDIVVRIGERTIRSPADVQAALAEVEAGARVAVTFLRKGSEQTATAEKPAAPPSDSRPRELRRRTAPDDATRVR